MEESLYMISDASRQLEVEAHVLRYWEDELHMDIPRNEQGYRCYTDEQLLVFRRIKALRENGYQLKAIKLILPRLGILDEEEFQFITALSEEMNRRAAELPEEELSAQKPSETKLTVSDGSHELSGEQRMEQFQIVMTDIMQNALEGHTEKLAGAISDKIGVKVIKEIDYLLRLRDEEEERRFRQLDEAIRFRQKKGRKETAQKEAAASRFPWKRSH